MGTITDLHAYLETMYPSLDVRAGLVRRWSGVRFKLWPNWREDGRTLPMLNSAFRAQVVDRASSIFHAVNDPADTLFFLVETWRRTASQMDRPRTGLQVLGRYLKQRRLMLTVGTEDLPYLYADDADEAATVRTRRYCLRCHVSDIRVRPLLTAIANQDFPPLRPRVHDNCYFINTSKNTIFHMFDDRGVDLISVVPATHETLASRFKDWVMV